MGKKFTIELEREAVLHATKLESYYAGESRKTDEKYAEIATKMQMSDDNDDILNGYANAAAHRAKDIIMQVLADVEITASEVVKEGTTPDVKFIFAMDVPETYDGNQKTALLEGIKAYMINWIMAEWYNVVAPAEAKPYYEKVGLLESDIRNRIIKRTKPVRRVVSQP